MRKFGQRFVLVSFAIATAGLAMSQQPSQPGGPGGKGKGGKGNDSYLSLFQNPQVRAELKATDQQLANLPAASLKALAEVLDAAQVQRLRGIYLQQKGNAAFLEADVKNDLKITADQAKMIQAALDEQTKGQNEMTQAGGFDPAKMQELQKTATAKIQSALSQEQKTAWTALIGQPFQVAGGQGGPGDAKEGKGGGGKGAVTFDQMVNNVMKVVPDKAPAQPKQPRKLLIFSKTGGFRHSSIEIGVRTLTIMGERTGAYTAFATENPEIFAWDKLKDFDGVFMVSTTGDFLNPSAGKGGGKSNKGGKGGDPKDAAKVGDAKGAANAEDIYKKNLVDFVKSGKGLMGLHAATDSYPKSWPLFASVIGAGFQSHPWTKLVPVKNLDPKHPVNAAFAGQDFEVTDEIYQFRLDTALPTKLHLLLALDVAKMSDAAKGNRGTKGPYPVSWIANYDKGRVFYCSLGHREDIFWNQAVLKHYLAGIQFALGDLDADAAPTAKAAD
jgi:uncharacterized protein